MDSTWATMAHLVQAGVDGLITNYPDRLRAVLAQAQLDLPPAFGRPVAGT